MRVIKSGRDKEWVVTCGGCGADLVYTGADIVVEEVARAFDGRAADVLSTPCRYIQPPKHKVCAVICPECGERVPVPEKATNRLPFAMDGGEWS